MAPTTRMYRVCVHAVQRTSFRRRHTDMDKLFLYISSEGQPARTFFLGSLTSDTLQFLEGISHITSGPVTLKLGHDSDPSSVFSIETMFDFLQDDALDTSALAKVIQLSDPRGGVYSLFVSVRSARRMYGFVLLRTTCLFRSTFQRTHQLALEVEYQSGPHLVHKPVVTRLNAGQYLAGETRMLHNGCNVTFSTLSRCSIRFAYTFSGSPTCAINFTLLEDTLPDYVVQRLLTTYDLRSFHPILFDCSELEGIELSIPSSLKSMLKVPESLLHEPLLANQDEMEDALNIPLVLCDENSTAVFECSLAVGKYPVPEPMEDMSIARVPSSQRGPPRATSRNGVAFLVDGLQTFEQYYRVMTSAQHSIHILGWELSLNFGLARRGNAWTTLSDVLIERALAGIRIRILIWRHPFLSWITRWVFLGSFSIESEISALITQCKPLGLKVSLIDATGSSYRLPNADHVLADPTQFGGSHIVFVLVGNPNGLVSSHHEKLLLVDAECPARATAFAGGFDIARGRMDQSAHLVPQWPLFKHPNIDIEAVKERLTGVEVQPLLPAMRFLWHDTCLWLTGSSVRELFIHFVQRWRYAFTRDVLSTLRSGPVEDLECALHPASMDAEECWNEWKNPEYTAPATTASGSSIHQYSNCSVTIYRVWANVIDSHYLLQEWRNIFQTAKRFIYIEHQYAFQNHQLTLALVQALSTNLQLHVIIIAPLQTDLPNGTVGELVDASPEQMDNHLAEIYDTAPDRVGVYCLIQSSASGTRKPIYVHSKLIVIDDEMLVNGSTNMDNMSLYKASELSFSIANPALAKHARVTLCMEHLGNAWNPTTMESTDGFLHIFKAFRTIANKNADLRTSGGVLAGRIVSMLPLHQLKKWRSQFQLPGLTFLFNKTESLNPPSSIKTLKVDQRLASAGQWLRQKVSSFRSRL